MNPQDDADVPGQAAAGQDRAEVDSDEARRAHERGPSASGEKVPRSEEAKNQEKTSEQSRALSGTTQPSRV